MTWFRADGDIDPAEPIKQDFIKLKIRNLLNKVISMSKKTIKRILFGMVLLSAFFISEILIIGAASAGQETEIIAVGEGTIEDNNVAGARNKAISVALKKAIEQYLSQYLGRQGMAGNFSSLKKCHTQCGRGY